MQKKDKVKVNLFFRGRQMEHGTWDLGGVPDRFIADTQNDGQIEKEPMMEGRIMSLVVSPK